MSMRVVVVTSLKGGVGKSVTAIHLATYFSDKHQVLVIDEDQNRTAMQWASKGKLPFTVADANTAIKQIPKHEIIIRDKQARKDEDDLSDLAEGADLLILPCIPDPISLHPTIATAKALGDSPFRILLTIVPPAPNTDGQSMQADLKASNIPVFETMIRRSIGFSKASLKGVPLRDMTGKTKLAWQDYVNLGKEVEALWG